MDKEKFGELIGPYEEIWLEKNIINSIIIDEGGSINEITFTVEPSEPGGDTSDGWLFVLSLDLEGIESLSDDANEAVMDKVEALTDDIGEEFATAGLDIELLEDFRIDINK